MSETDRKLDRIAELLEEQMRGRGNSTSSRGPSIGSSGGFDFFGNIKDATEPLKQSLKDFDRAISDSNTSLHTFSKYTYAADNGLAAITRLGTGIPYLGKAIEKLGAAFGGLVGAIFKQTDELLQASDQFAKIGAAGSLTTLDIMKMGEQAGLTTKDLGILTNATGKIGTGLIGLGANATDGIKAFAGMTAVTKEVRQDFQRMGVSQTELIDQQAKYVEIQALSGKSMLIQTMGAEKLKKSSLEYSENLLRLSALTGKGADVLQEEQKQQAMELEELIAKRQEDDKIAELRKSGADAEADSLQKEQESRAAFVRDIAAKYGKATGVALGKVARTGSYDQTTAGYANLGIDAGKIQSDIKNGMDGTKLANEVGEQLKVGMSSLLKNLGQGAQFNAQELFASMGFTDFKELLGNIGTKIGVSDQAQSDAAKKLIEDNKLGIGKAATDFAQESRNFVKETENSLNLTKQGFIALANVFVQGPALVEKNLKEAGEKLAEFVKNMIPASAKKQTNIPVANEAGMTKGEVAIGGAATAAVGTVGTAVLGSVPVVGTAFKIIKKVGKTATWAAIIDMVGGDEIAAWLKGDTKVEDIKKLPTTIATQTPIAVNAVKEELSPGPKQFDNIKQGLQGVEKGWENTKNKFIKELTNLLGGLSEISSASTAPVATPAASAGSPDTSATRSHGTTGETGKEVEPKDVVAQLHAGEKVLPKEEAKMYIAGSYDQTTAAPANLGINADILKKSSLEYSENLLRLSALTGKGADVSQANLQEEQKQQAMELEELIAKRQEDDKIAELRKSGAIAEADSLQKEQDNRVAFLTDMSAKYGKATGEALGKVARTGSYDQTTAGYTNLGIDAGKLQSDLKNGVDGTKLANEVGEQVKSGLQSLSKNLGQKVAAATPVTAPEPVVAAAPAVATPAVVAAGKPWGKSGDADQDIGPAAVEAKSSTNKTNVGNFTIEDYIPNDRKMNDADYNYIPVATPTDVNPTDKRLAAGTQTINTAPESALAQPVRPAISASETLSKVTLEAVNPVVVDALKKITTSSAPEAAVLASNNSNSAEMMTKALSLFTDKCDQMISKLADANDIAQRILKQGY